METRRQLVEELEQLEREFEDPDPAEAAWLMDPGPDVRYKMALEYLSELCRLMEGRAGEVLEDEELEGLDDDYRQWR